MKNKLKIADNETVMKSCKKLCEKYHDVLEAIADDETIPERERSACFTGHRDMAESESAVSERLYILIEKLVTEEQIAVYYAGGAVGFDTVAAKCVLRLREKYPQVRLRLVLPCSNEEQTRKWTSLAFLIAIHPLNWCFAVYSTLSALVSI